MARARGGKAAAKSAGSAKAKPTATARNRPIEQYDHRDKHRPNNPPVGLVTPKTDRDAGKKTYAHDPHLDPTLQWSGKAERLSFEVPTVSLHVHERIDPKTVMEAVRRRNGSKAPAQRSLFEAEEEQRPLREALDFYKHAHSWSNRLIAGDSLLVMNSLLEKEGMAGKVQMVYVDPPYGVRYGSNFQPFVNKREVKDRSDEDLTQEPEMIRAFRDTWELGIHSYLTYLRDRLVLCHALLHETGSCFVQISDENLHLVRNLLDEVFGAENLCAVITFRKTSGASSPLAKVNVLGAVADYLVWYAKDREQVKYRQLYVQKQLGGEGAGQYTWVEPPGKPPRPLDATELRNIEEILDAGGRLLRPDNLASAGFSESLSKPFVFQGSSFSPPENAHWKTTAEGLGRLVSAKRVIPIGKRLYYKRYFDDFPVFPLVNVWLDTVSSGFAEPRLYVVQTVARAIERCLLMTTDPGDLVLDPTCGSGSTAYVAEQWGRRWITCDTSRVAVALAKQRLMTAMYDYYALSHPTEGVGSGFLNTTVPHVTLKSIANNEPAKQETLYDQPKVDGSRVRVTGPFTVEAVPSPTVVPIGDVHEVPAGDVSVARSGETLRQAEWRAELLKTGIRGKNGQMILFSRVEPLSGTRWLHADGEMKANDFGAEQVREVPGSKSRVVISFGPDHAPLEQRQVEVAWEEARTLSPRPALIVFAAFQFDPEAAKDIDELKPEKTGMTFLKVQMNPDLLTDDLKKKRSSNESFWLMGQPDVELRRVKSGEHKGKLELEVHGFDYYNTKTGQIESGDTARIALWMLDPDYDGRSLFPRQVFFPMADEDGGWAKVARNLRAEIDEERIEAYRGTVSLPRSRCSGHVENSQALDTAIVHDYAIESGLVKTPRVVVRDDGLPRAKDYRSKLYHIYQHVKDDLNRKAEPHEPLHDLVLSAYHLLGKDWLETARRWSEQKRDTPPVLITVANRTETAARVKYAFDRHKILIDELCDAEKTLHIDSKVLDKAEAQVEDLGGEDGGAADEEDTPTRRLTKDEQAERLRLMVDTVGERGKPGGNVQNVISVGMLSEGWDAKTVTQIMGLRAFSSQLLCEQVVGRGLRRTSYELNPETGFFDPEYVNIFGVPFTFLPHEGGADVVPPPPPPKSKIEAVPEKAGFEISWPNVVRIEHVLTPQLTLDLEKVGALDINAAETPTLAKMAPVVEGKPDVTRLSEIDLEDLARRFRMQRVVFDAAVSVYEQMQPGWPASKERLLAQLVRQAERFLASPRVRIVPALFEQDDRRRRILLALNMTRIVQHFWQALRFENATGLRPVFDTERPIRRTGDMLPWYTGRPWEYTERSHVNRCVYDSTWEATEAYVLDHSSDVAAWVKNDHLGFEVLYVFDGIVRKYRPDFLIRLRGGRMLVLEVKGQESEQTSAKHGALDEWTRAVTAHGGFAEWTWAVARRPAEVADVIARSASH